MNKLSRAAAGPALAGGLGSLAYPIFFRHWCLTWGARPDEVTRKLPGDELLVMEPGSLIMEREMLLGIKQRAEDLALR